MLGLLLAIVIAPDPELAAPLPLQAPPHVYLHPPGDACDSRAPSDEIVVCGNKDADERYRTRPIEDDRFAESPLRAQVKVGNGTLALHNEDKDIGGGMHSKRAMITLTIPF